MKVLLGGDDGRCFSNSAPGPLVVCHRACRTIGKTWAVQKLVRGVQQGLLRDFLVAVAYLEQRPSVYDYSYFFEVAVSNSRLGLSHAKNSHAISLPGHQNATKSLHTMAAVTGVD